MARLSRLRVSFGSSSRPHTAPQQYSVMTSWNGRLNSSALFREFSTYSLPSTVLRISSPFSNVCLSMTLLPFDQTNVRILKRPHAVQSALGFECGSPLPAGERDRVRGNERSRIRYIVTPSPGGLRPPTSPRQ